MELKAMSIEEIKKNKTEVIEITGFTDKNPVIVEVQPVSIMGLCSKGKIPNPLLGAAKEILFQGSVNDSGLNAKEYTELLEIILKEVLVSPTYEEFERNGLSLTDTQRSELFIYSQRGVEQLKTFREKYTHNTNFDNEQEVQDKAE
ncbi:M18 family aminopeptidase [Clostridium botulinum]|uniref:hypothetical protein n=1 Tax=Clostridium TaxID=1485 RepID=UPI0004D8B447|nr:MULTISPECIES: hypothetical protein [Clostridium]KEI08069.1 hypothetical protein Z958_p0151 [Clostridium novyi B str. NCTC 9691]KEI12794.1 hypothetical protein Z958_05875 [Clostridium novyi B str. NCTC 9691]MCD3217487.1 M18 family aminopeptidase [Clostridium botulinum C]NFV47532.1 M18 family aminopeptidase [Clostridium botulinum]